MRSIILVVAGCALGLAFGAPAMADPCKAIPDRGPAPAWVKQGARFSGQVRYVVDGDGFCVGRSPAPATWIEVRMVDFDAPELAASGGAHAKAVMIQIASGRKLDCVVRPGRRGTVRTHDRVLAACRLAGVPLADRLRRAGVREGGN